MTAKSQTLKFPNKPRLIAGMSVVGKKEGDGPLGKYFDEIDDDPKMGKSSFEKGESAMFAAAVEGAAAKAGIDTFEIEALFAGDLLNQLVSSNYAARDLPVSYYGLYSACSTMTEALALASAMVNAGYYNIAACVTGSHFAAAERQYRYPLEYGCQRPPYAQWTVTGAGCSVIADKGDGPFIASATIGKVADYGVTDANNMGAAMAPAAFETLLAVLDDTEKDINEFDAVFTGDLGRLGAWILRDLCREQGVELGQKYSDCGEMIFSREQNCYSGGSGAGCSACVLNSFILDKLNKHEFNRVLLLATGALMSPTTSFQGESIPAISHGIILEND